MNCNGPVHCYLEKGDLLTYAEVDHNTLIKIPSNSILEMYLHIYIKGLTQGSCQILGRA